MESPTEQLQGQLLVASPRLTDPNFFKTVVLMVQHSEQGALGLVLNRPLETTIRDAWEQISGEPCASEQPLHQGGPCEGPLMVVHTDQSVSEMQVMPGVFFSTDRTAVEKLVTDAGTELKFFVGYAGWGPMQLEAELAEGAWLVTPATSSRIFSGSNEQWEQITKAIARAKTVPWIDPKLIPDDPSVN